MSNSASPFSQNPTKIFKKIILSFIVPECWIRQICPHSTQFQIADIATRVHAYYRSSTTVVPPLLNTLPARDCRHAQVSISNLITAHVSPPTPSPSLVNIKIHLHTHDICYCNNFGFEHRLISRFITSRNISNYKIHNWGLPRLPTFECFSLDVVYVLPSNLNCSKIL